MGDDASVEIKSFARRFAVNGINGFGGGEIRCRSTTQPAATTPIQNVHLTQTAVIRRRLSLVKVSILGSCCRDIDSRVHLAAGRVDSSQTTDSRSSEGESSAVELCQLTGDRKAEAFPDEAD